MLPFGTDWSSSEADEIMPVMPVFHIHEWNNYCQNRRRRSAAPAEYVSFYGFGNGGFNSSKTPNGRGDGAFEYDYMKGRT